MCCPEYPAPWRSGNIGIGDDMRRALIDFALLLVAVTLAVGIILMVPEASNAQAALFLREMVVWWKP